MSVYSVHDAYVIIRLIILLLCSCLILLFILFLFLFHNLRPPLTPLRPPLSSPLRPPSPSTFSPLPPLSLPLLPQYILFIVLLHLLSGVGHCTYVDLSKRRLPYLW